MPYRVLANTCDNGPCPTLFIDDATGDVLVQGYVNGDAPPTPPPVGEAVVHIPAAAWRKMLTQLGT